MDRNTEVSIEDDPEKLQYKNSFLDHKDKRNDFELSWKHSLKQVLAACIVHSLVIQAGINMAFSAVLLPQLKNSSSDMQINLNQGSWIASILTVSLPSGALIIGPLMDKFGRKKMCMLTTVPFIISWLLHVFATNLCYILAARVLAGFGAGLSTVGIVYVSEISHPKYRPMMLTFNSVFVTFGILLTCILGFGLHWRVMAKIFLALIILSLIGLFFVPESPYWLLIFKDDKQMCAKSIRWLYADSRIFEEQYQKVLESKQTLQETSKKSLHRKIKDNFKYYLEPVVLKPVLILLALFIIQQLSSAYVIIFYAVDIFRKIGGSFKHIGLIDEFVALILLGGIRFVMSIVLAAISKKVGRRVLMFISALGMIVSSFILASYMIFTRSDSISSVVPYTNGTFKETLLDRSTEPDGTVAVVLVLCYICFSSFGWLVIPWTLIGELLPVKVRGTLGGVMVSVAYILMFLILKVSPFLMESIRLEYIFLALGITNVIGLVFLYLFLPETLGKTFKDIAKYFDKNYE
ncbi:hypothetical protein ABEB36_007577 [Hypothenemus hampei]|uniref:Major facilitator superfamily (MFS) profile domain-containing protein n=1 Tax=Hypothenemus hampei TaxID=57062 RepID=A0ABD1EVG1_HYPHA